MSSTLATRWQQFRTWPRAIQWLVGALVIVAAFIFVHDYVWEISRYFNEQASSIERKVIEAGNINERERNAQAMRSAMAALGPVEIPGELAQSQEALTAVVNEVVSKYRSVADNSFDFKSAASMPAVLSKVLPGKKVERIGAELRFDASVEDAIAIIAELESRPEIEAVTTVRMIRQPSIKKLRVNLTVDAWVVTDGTSRRGGVSTSV